MDNYQKKYEEMAGTILQLIVNTGIEDQKATIEIIAYNLKRANDDLIENVAEMRRVQKDYSDIVNVSGTEHAQKTKKIAEEIVDNIISEHS